LSVHWSRRLLSYFLWCIPTYFSLSFLRDIDQSILFSVVEKCVFTFVYYPKIEKKRNKKNSLSFYFLFCLVINSKC
jgi:hypothetical protein